MISTTDQKKGISIPPINNAVVLILICFTCIFIFWRTGLLSSGFRIFVNDHLMINMHHDVQTEGLLLTLKKWLLIDQAMSRFQPFYYIQAVTLSTILGSNPILWFSYGCLLTSLMGCFLFLFARLLEMPILVALIFAGMTLIGPQAATWAQPSNPQVVGMFLLSSALLLAAISAKPTRNKVILDIAFILLALLASLSKESFIIFIPALIGIKIWLHSRFNHVSLYRSLVQNRFVVGSLLSIGALEILYIVFVISVKGMGYAGIDQSTLDLFKLSSVVLTLLKRGHFEISVISISLFLLISYRQKEGFSDFQIFYPLSLIFFLIVFPQIILYSKSGIDGIYLVPAIVGFALLTSQVLSLLKSRSSIWGNFLIGITIVVILSGLPPLWNTYSQMAKDSKVINSFLHQVQKCTPNNEPILLVVNPRVRFEATLATKRTLDYVFQRDNLIVATYGLEKANFYSDSFKNIEPAWSFLDPQTLVGEFNNRTIINFEDKQSIAAIAVFDRLNRDFLATSSDWFFRKSYQRIKFQNSFSPIILYCKKQV